MQTFSRQLKPFLISVFFACPLFAFNPVMAESDMQMQEMALRARVLSNRQKTDHSAHFKPLDKELEFRGVFYGYLPCDDCDGIKATLSLKQNHNYLLVTQPAKDSSREYYEKGKYSWDDEKRSVILTSKKDSSTRHYRIEDEGTLIQLNADGTPITGDQDRFALKRSDTVKSRQVHIH